jgi:pimeloyl-ACP methyl ester carboxylesterase
MTRNSSLNRRTLLASAVGSATAVVVPAMVPAVASAVGEGADALSPTMTQPDPGPWRQRGTVLRPGGVIGYAVAGAESRGLPLVFLPKLGGWIADWSAVASRLDAEYRLIGIDPPGHGSSRMLGEPPQVQTLAESAAMIRAALDELGIERCVLVGNSLGGCIAATLTALWPETVARLILVSTAVYPRDPLATILADEARVDPPIYDAAGNPLPRSAAQAQARFGMSAAFIEEMNQSRAMAGRWIRASERGVRREGLSALLSQVDVPTLLLYGDSGPYLRHRIAAEKLLKRVTSVTIGGVGSFVHQEKPEDTASAIREFLRS